MATNELCFDAVKLPPTAHYDQPIHGISFTLSEGEALLLEWRDEQGWPALADAAMGLLLPVAGQVTFGGQSWDTWSPDEAASLRSRIGRVFADDAWISNLDIDENMTLAQRHHGADPATIYPRALELAARFGREALPSGRPAWISRHDAEICQWIRALLAEPRLLILEAPTRDVSDDECEHLVAAVAREREKGACVIWISDDPRLQNNPSLNIQVHARVKGDQWESRA